MTHSSPEDMKMSQILRQKVDEIGDSDLTKEELVAVLRQEKEFTNFFFNEKPDLTLEQHLQIKSSKSSLLQSHGLEIVMVRKDSKNHCFGLSIWEPINNGLIVCCGVVKDSSAAQAGIKYGDLIYAIDNQFIKNMSNDKVRSVLYGPKTELHKLLIRKRPFVRTIELHKFNGNIPGFSINSGAIETMFSISNADAGGLFAKCRLFEVNGKSVARLSDEEVMRLIRDSPKDSVTITIMPSIIYSKVLEKVSQTEEL